MTIDEMIAILRADKAGKRIQGRYKICDGKEHNWFDLNEELPIQFLEYDYRVKPEPREGWIFPGWMFKSRNDAFSEWIKVREVLE